MMSDDGLSLEKTLFWGIQLVAIGSVVAAAKVNSSGAVSRVAWVDDRWSTIAISVCISARERAVAVSIVVVIVRSARGAAMVTRST
jgi:hypothetical protein